MNEALFVVLVLSYLFVIAVLLRQLNRGREEPTVMLEKFQTLALPVRWVQLAQEGGEEWEHRAWLEHLDEVNRMASVQDVEGGPVSEAPFSSAHEVGVQGSGRLGARQLTAVLAKADGSLEVVRCQETPTGAGLPKTRVAANPVACRLADQVSRDAPAAPRHEPVTLNSSSLG